MKILTGADFKTMYAYNQSLYSHVIVRNTKWHNSANTDPLDIFLPHVDFVIVQEYVNIIKIGSKVFKL